MPIQPNLLAQGKRADMQSMLEASSFILHRNNTSFHTDQDVPATCKAVSSLPVGHSTKTPLTHGDQLPAASAMQRARLQLQLKSAVRTCSQGTSSTSGALLFLLHPPACSLIMHVGSMCHSTYYCSNSAVPWWCCNSSLHMAAGCPPMRTLCIETSFPLLTSLPELPEASMTSMLSPVAGKRQP